jgi:hypothetical protein
MSGPFTGRTTRKSPDTGPVQSTVQASRLVAMCLLANQPKEVPTVLVPAHLKNQAAILLDFGFVSGLVTATGRDWGLAYAPEADDRHHPPKRKKSTSARPRYFWKRVSKEHKLEWRTVDKGQIKT